MIKIVFLLRNSWFPAIHPLVWWRLNFTIALYAGTRCTRPRWDVQSTSFPYYLAESDSWFALFNARRPDIYHHLYLMRLDSLIFLYLFDTYVETLQRAFTSSNLSFSSRVAASSLLSWFIIKNEHSTINDPTQYSILEYWLLSIICPINDNGIVIDSPTVTTKGVVRSIAYAQQRSAMNDDAELAYYPLVSVQEKEIV